MNGDMKPVNGEAPVLIPVADMRDNVPGTYGWLKKLYWGKNRKKHKMSDGSSFSYDNE